MPETWDDLGGEGLLLASPQGADGPAPLVRLPPPSHPPLPLVDSDSRDGSSLASRCDSRWFAAVLEERLRRWRCEPPATSAAASTCRCSTLEPQSASSCRNLPDGA